LQLNWHLLYPEVNLLLDAFVKSVLVTVNPLPTLTVVNPAAVCSPSTVDITNTVQTTNTGTTTKYYTTLALANAGAASDITTPAAVATTGTYYIRNLLLDALL
jgi:hypothetical protein